MIIGILVKFIGFQEINFNIIGNISKEMLKNMETYQFLKIK